MRYELLDPTGSPLAVYECRDVAFEEFLRMAEEELQAADELRILEIDDHGETVGCIEIDTDLLAAKA